MDKEGMFQEIKGNCADHMDIGGVDHCIYYEDDCKITRCPRMRKFNSPIREEAQCPTCGSIVPPHKISVYKLTFQRGIVYGVLIGAPLLLVILSVINP